MSFPQFQSLAGEYQFHQSTNLKQMTMFFGASSEIYQIRFHPESYLEAAGSSLSSICIVLLSSLFCFVIDLLLLMFEYIFNVLFRFVLIFLVILLSFAFLNLF